MPKYRQAITSATSTPLLTYEDLASWLNDNVRHLRRLVFEGRIPYRKVGHFVRFDAAEIAGWLEDQRRGPERD